MSSKYYESVFISDSHLGMRNIDSKKLLSFLCSFECNNLYLVGDIIDVWSLKKRVHWTKINSQIINEIYKKYLRGTRIYYTPGNHDDIFKDMWITIDEKPYFFSMNDCFIHRGLNGKQYLVTHGDKYDSVVSNVKWLAHIGSILYDIMFFFNKHIHKMFGMKWSISHWSKRSIKYVVSFLNKYEDILTKEIIEEKLDGIICGHIHYPKISFVNGIEYMNCGDFVESFSAVVEYHDGSFELIKINN